MNHQTLNPAITRLEPLVGAWTMGAVMGGRVVGGIAKSTFEWMERGAFLVQHADAELAQDTPPEWVANSPFPLTTITGLDDSQESYYMLYADGRGVFRVYRMSLDDGVWKMWRDQPGFFQRFTGTFNDDGNTIVGAWEGSRDGETWEHDFDVTYTKIR